MGLGGFVWIIGNWTIKNKFPLPIKDEIAGPQYFTTINLTSGFH
jgi:hypothetical protein